MKIAFFADVLLPPLGGIETHVLETSLALMELGHEVRIFTPTTKKDLEGLSQTPYASLNIHPCLGLPLPFIWTNFRFSYPIYLKGYFKNWRPDVIHFHTAGPICRAAVKIAKTLQQSPQGEALQMPLYQPNRRPTLNKRPLLAGTFHSYLMTPEYLSNYRIPKSFIKRLSDYLWKITISLYNNCDVVISPSEWVGQDIKSHGLTKPIRVVHNGTPLKDFSRRLGNEAISLMVAKYDLSENTLLYVGRLNSEKGLDVLLKALKIVNQELNAKRFSLASLLIVGDGPLEPVLIKLAQSLKIEDKIKFLGRIAHENLTKSGVYEVSQAFVTASTSENQPITIIEAMAKGLPIIGVRARGLPDIIKDNGLLANPNDPEDLAQKVVELLSDKVKREKMSQESQKMAQEYSVDNTAQNLLKVYTRQTV